MSTGTLVQAPPRRLKILWADDDDPRFLQFEYRHLRRQGHTLVCTADFESTAEKLSSEKFDLLILDQQMRWNGKREIYAGTSLAGMLCEGELGELNRNIPFLFWTASEAWVNDSGFDVRGCSSCLGIQEKGPPPGDDLNDYVCEAISMLPASGSGGDEEGAGPDGPSTGAYVLSEAWAGVVLEVGSGIFHSRLASVGDPLPDHEATLPFEIVAAAEQEEIVEGATFRWEMAIEEGDTGQRVARSWVRFDERPEISQEDFEEALRAAVDDRLRREGASG